MTKYKGFIGTYTKKSSKGVYEIELDTVKEELTVKGVAAEGKSPTYVNMDAEQEFLYTVAPGGMASFKIGEALEPIGHVDEKEGSPCHVSVSPDGAFAASATYLDGTIALYSRDKESGKVTEQLSVIQHEGGGPHERQDAAHAHFSGFTPDGKYLVAVDLGTDEIISYSYQSGELKQAAVFNTEAGAGPRHLTFHPEKPLAYVMTELSNEVLTFAYDSSTGAFRQLQSISAIPGDFNENSQGSAIHVSSDGRFVYAGNRGHNSIAVFAADEETGELTHLEYVETEGNWPRDFVLDPSESFVVAANQESDTLVLFKRDKETGRLSSKGIKVKVPEPVCVKFVSK